MPTQMTMLHMCKCHVFSQPLYDLYIALIYLIYIVMITEPHACWATKDMCRKNFSNTHFFAP